jgi:hypothetical protein
MFEPRSAIQRVRVYLISSRSCIFKTLSVIASMFTKPIVTTWSKGFPDSHHWFSVSVKLHSSQRYHTERAENYLIFPDQMTDFLKSDVGTPIAVPASGFSASQMTFDIVIVQLKAHDKYGRPFMSCPRAHNLVQSVLLSTDTELARRFVGGLLSGAPMVCVLQIGGTHRALQFTAGDWSVVLLLDTPLRSACELGKHCI